MLQRKRTRFSASIWAIPILITGLLAAAPAVWTDEAPVADAGPHRRVHLGDTVQFDGSGSYDPDDGHLGNVGLENQAEFRMSAIGRRPAKVDAAGDPIQMTGGQQWTASGIDT